MGEVYTARDTRLNRTVAIKVLSAAIAADALGRTRFEYEARLVASLAHPHICTLHDVGSHNGLSFLVVSRERRCRNALRHDARRPSGRCRRVADAIGWTRRGAEPQSARRLQV